ncbi:DNA-binding GntR family transcriptional regulator [Neobacillus niacini]|nr:hypothetical protein [Neobacillus niacini]MDR7076060.1 DNA-binding GntR family transcriptional regulator [Neobacillus niacini]
MNSLNVEDIEDIYQLRSQLEKMAVQQSIKNIEPGASRYFRGGKKE